MRQIRRILYVRTDRMGDVLMNLPAIRALRLSYPKAWITLLADRSVSALFKGHPDLDEVMEVDAPALDKSLIEKWKFFNLIRSVGYDIAVVSNPNKFFHWLLFAGRVPVRVGWRRKWHFFLNQTVEDKKNISGAHEIDHNLALVAGVTTQKWDGKIFLRPDSRAILEIKEALDGFCGPAPVIAMHTGTSNAKKRWSEENFAELCRQIHLSGRPEKIVFVGGAEEERPAQKIIEDARVPALNLCGKTSLQSLAAFFGDRRVKGLVSSDSGPVHLAWISGKPVVAFYAADLPGSDPQRWGPRDGRSEVIHKKVSDITSAEVLECVKRILAYG